MFRKVYYLKISKNLKHTLISYNNIDERQYKLKSGPVHIKLLKFGLFAQQPDPILFY